MGAPGWDDAPYVEVARSDAPKPVTFVYPYYCNPRFLTRQVAWWAMYPPEVREHVSVIVVDDGSPTDKAAQYLLQEIWSPVTLRLFVIEVDVRWNWLAARNIGFHHASNGWCVGTDMDHVVTEEVARALVYGAHDQQTIYRFSRREHTGQLIHPHPNSYFITRAMFWKVGGYDEALSGFYGTDGDWRRRCAATAPVATLKDALVRHEYQGDSSTTHYQRKQPLDAMKKQIVQKRGRKWRPKVLSFPYHEVTL